ncbi:hypothetical protein CYMTET_41424 [Cymbomonas tetramitiformis]|uniref:Uncharacterized protein n=1 Tax=Cymbomonas tetramitiformis TaxID=36881 RepID=A0AAE0C638_9CHLO|nr:hypothetical protein CYMTET_41424 [Cymbomonas tetramitiformis]
MTGQSYLRRSCQIVRTLAFFCLTVSVASQFEDTKTTQLASHDTLVCGVPRVKSTAIENNHRMHVEFEIPLPNGDSTDLIAFGIFFGDLGIVNRKLACSLALDDLDLVFDPSEEGFSGNLSDKCMGNEYPQYARYTGNTITDSRNGPKVCPLVADGHVCTPKRPVMRDVVWFSTVTTNNNTMYECNLGVSTWKLSFDISDWTASEGMNKNGITKEVVDDAQIFTFPVRIFITSVSKSSAQAETYYSPYRFQLHQKASVFMNLPIMETQLSGFRSHYIKNFQQTSGDVAFAGVNPLQDETAYLDIVKVTFEMVFFKESDKNSLPTISVDVNDLVVNVDTSTGSGDAYQLYDLNNQALPSGGQCLDISTTDKSSISEHSAPEVVNQKDVMETDAIRSYNGTFFKQVLSVTCYLRLQ